MKAITHLKRTAVLTLISIMLNPTLGVASDKLSARNLPGDSKILFFMGQNSDALEEYKQSVLDKDPAMPKPGGVTLYTSLNILKNGNYEDKPIGKPLDSILNSGNWGDGEHNLTRTLKDYPDAAIAIGLDLKDNIYVDNNPSNCKQVPTRAIAATNDPDIRELTPQYHKLVDTLILKLKATRRPVFLRIGYEFDGPWNCYEPESYKKTFRFIKERIDILKADNIATVWQSSSAPVDDDNRHYSPSRKNHLNNWYPGNDVVDWVGMSTFMGSKYAKYQAPSFFARTIYMNNPVKIQNKMLTFARKHNKPVMIAEASAQGFSFSRLMSSPIYKREDTPVKAEEIWQYWFEDWFGFIHNNKDIIRAVAYINENWEAKPLWRCDEGSQKYPGQKVPVDPNNPKAPACPGGVPWGDTRVQENAFILKKFKAELQKPIYVQ